MQTTVTPGDRAYPAPPWHGTDSVDTASAREIEMGAIAEVNRSLERAAAPDANPLERLKALYRNHRMWSIFVQDLLTPGNLLPAKLRASYVSLGLFAQRQSIAALTGPQDISLLISINNDVLEALTAQATATA